MLGFSHWVIVKLSKATSVSTRYYHRNKVFIESSQDQVLVHEIKYELNPTFHKTIMMASPFVLAKRHRPMNRWVKVAKLGGYLEDKESFRRRETQHTQQWLCPTCWEEQEESGESEETHLWSHRSSRC